MNFLRILPFAVLLLFAQTAKGQKTRWQNVDSLFGPLPSSIHVFRSHDSLDGKPGIAFYVMADLKDRSLDFTADTSRNRRLTPSAFYEKNKQPLVVVNTTFFSFETNRNLNTVIKDGKLVGYNIHSLPGRGKDTFLYHHPLNSAIGITRKGKTDIAWLYTDSSLRYPIDFQRPVKPFTDSLNFFPIAHAKALRKEMVKSPVNWKKVRTAVGGGPVLMQDGVILITNDLERKFGGKAIDDRHPRTAMGYTKDGKLIILVVQGRFPGVAEGASLRHEAAMLLELGCTEALNLDGGGSSCLLINGRETITPSDKGIQRPVPAVFMIREKK